MCLNIPNTKNYECKQVAPKVELLRIDSKNGYVYDKDMNLLGKGIYESFPNGRVALVGIEKIKH